MRRPRHTPFRHKLVALARAEPGKLNAAKIGAGAPPHLAPVQCTSMTGTHNAGTPLPQTRQLP